MDEVDDVGPARTASGLHLPPTFASEKGGLGFRTGPKIENPGVEGVTDG